MIYFNEIKEEKKSPEFGYCLETGKIKIKVTYKNAVILEVDGKPIRISTGDLFVLAEQIPDLIDFVQCNSI